jgi:hypothetical protein
VSCFDGALQALETISDNDRSIIIVLFVDKRLVVKNLGYP